MRSVASAAAVRFEADEPARGGWQELTKLTVEDQLFVTAFVRSHGSIKEMEALFGISYPTVKNRLNAISARLPFVDVCE